MGAAKLENTSFSALLPSPNNFYPGQFFNVKDTGDRNQVEYVTYVT